MDKTVKTTIQLVKKLIVIRTENATTLNQRPIINQEFDNLEIDYHKLNTYAQAADVSTKSSTLKKQEARNTYIHELRKLFALLCTVARHQNDNTLIHNTHFSKTKLIRLSNTILIAKSREIKKYCQQHPTYQQQAGITQQDLTNLDTLAKEFENLYQAPASELAKRKKAIKRLKDYASNVSKRIHKNLIPMLKGMYQIDNPDLWNQIHTVVYKQHQPVRHHDIIGKIIDQTTNQAVPGAIIQIPKLNYTKKLKAGGGLFYLNNIPQGKYIAIVSQPNYITKSKTFTKIDNIPLRITISMTPIQPTNKSDIQNTPLQTTDQNP